MKAIILEDNVELRKANISAINKWFPLIEFIGEGGSVEEGIKIIEDNPDVNLLFLDVELEDGVSFDLLEHIDYFKYKIVFITSYDKYAVQAFKYSAIDYLLKPLDENELLDCLKKVIARSSTNFEALEVFLHNRNQTSRIEKKVSLQNSDGIYVAEINDIVYLEAYGNYSKVYIQQRKMPLVITKTLKEFEKMFKDDGFIRTHHGYMVNKNQIRKFVNKSGSYLILKNGIEVPVSQRKFSEVRAFIESI